MIRRICGVAVLALAVIVNVPSIASADTATIGSTTQPSGSGGSKPGSPALTFVQTSSANFPVAVPPGGGRITSWSTNTAGSTAGATVKLVVLRPTGGTYRVIAVDTETLPTPLPPSNVATFTLATPIVVNGGDLIGISALSNNAVLIWSGGTTPVSDTGASVSTTTPSPPAPGQNVQVFEAGGGNRINVSAVVSRSLDAGVTTSGPARPSVGNPVVLGSTVTNHSPNSGSITFTDTVPARLTIKLAVAGDGSCGVSGQTVTCTISNLAGGSSVPVSVLVTPSATGSYVNRVSVAPADAGVTDPNLADNTAIATLRVSATAPGVCTVPKLRGTPAGVSKRLLKLLGCKVKVKRKKGHGVAHGAVLKTKPKPGTYKLGRKVTLIVRR